MLSSSCNGKDNQAMTISAAARALGIHRTTVKRYIQREPMIVDAKGKVILDLLKGAIYGRQRLESRGFPLRGKRPTQQKRFKLGEARNQKKHFPKSFSQRLDIIKEQIEFMNDADQKWLWPRAAKLFSGFFRPANCSDD